MTAGAPGLQVWRSSGRLADGREIIYFDEAAGLHRADVPDGRDLPPRRPDPDGTGPPGPEPDVTGPDVTGPDEANGLRLDLLSGDWVMYAAGRQGRPYRPDLAGCPLCPSRPDHRTEIPAPGYDVAVFENRYPALLGPGRCEVICFTADHDVAFAGLTSRRVGTVFAAWADRTRELGGLPGVEHVYCFENRGEEIGVTLHHPHGQVYAFPFVPPRTRRLAELAAAHRKRHRSNLFDDVIAAELADGRRIVAADEHWTAFVPRAARWPFELMIFPTARVADLAEVGAQARAGFGPVYLDVLRRLDALFGAPMPYIAAWQQAPARGPDAAASGNAVVRAEFGLHLHLMAVRRAPGKLKYLAGTESGAGAWSNDVLPETAAELLRQVSRD